MNNRTTIVHLNYDVLKAIMLLVVASAGGAKDLATAIAVCKGFAIFGDDKELLMMANFEDFALPNSVEHCQHIRSLLIRCAEAGNAGARYKLAQVVLFQFSHLNQKSFCDNRQLACSSTLPPFLSYFMPEQAMNSDSDGKRFNHFELVSFFLSECSLFDHVSMLPHMQNYVGHFQNVTEEWTLFYFWYNKMTSILRAVVNVGRNRKTPFYSFTCSESKYCPIMPKWRSVRHVMLQLQESIRYYYLNDFPELSPSIWEELKRECHYISEELLSSECYAKPLEETAKYLDIGKRFFYYLAFRSRVTQEIDLALDRDGDNLRAAIMHYAGSYVISQQEAALCFDEMWSD